MSSRKVSDLAAGDAAGFTLLECTVALLLFTLLVLGLSRLTVAHDRLVSGLETWLVDDPVYFVDQADDDLARVLGTPARMSEAVPALPGPPPAPAAWAVSVQSVSTVLDPAQATAVVVMTEL